MPAFWSHYLWRGLPRLMVFWVTILLVTAIAYVLCAPLSLDAAYESVLNATHGYFDGISTRDFATSLAFFIGGLATALALYFGIFHALFIILALRRARKRVERAANGIEFSQQYDRIRHEIEQHPILGHAWYEFDKALIRPEIETAPIRNTVRPQTFINIGVAREKLFGLKIMPSIPGYFVGLGLLLTFIGLVIALSSAVNGMNQAHQAAGAGAAAMQTALAKLLEAASFKFTASIAGLGASLALSLIFRIYTIGIEGSFHKFCEAVEKRLLYRAPQSVAEEMNRTLAEQRDQLKEINSADFFGRMGQAMSAPIQTALQGAFDPLAGQIQAAMSQLNNTSQQGVEQLLNKFSDSVQGGAGTELRELTVSLKAMQVGLEGAQRGIAGSGGEFARLMTSAAEDMNRLVLEAGQSLSQSASINHVALQDVVLALRETFDRASSKVDEELGRSAAGAASRVEEAMGRVLYRLEEQIGGFQAGLAGFQTSTAGHLDETRGKVAAAQEAAVDVVSRLSMEAARSLEAGLGNALEKINLEVNRFAHALNAAERSLAAQAEAVGSAASQSRLAADAFGKTASDVRMAAAPLAQSGERVATAAQTMSETVTNAVAALEQTQKEARTLAEGIAGQVQTLTNVWNSYKERFEGVDEDLGKAFEKLGEQTQRHMGSVENFVAKIDGGFLKAIDALGARIEAISESTNDLAETSEGLKNVMVHAAQNFRGALTEASS